jgi:transcriptional regulator with XRE-family HTH domain
MHLKKKDKVYIGKALKRRRMTKGMSQGELASRSRIDRTYISELERNISSPSIFTVLKLAKGFGICPGIFITEIYKEIDFDRIFEQQV